MGSGPHTHHSRKITIVGAGLAGLTAAAVAARAGADVLVLDAREDIGGRARTEECDGFFLNQGAHALYCSTEAIAILRKLGIDAAGSSPDLARAYGSLRGRIDLLPASPTTALRSRLIGTRAKLELGRAMASTAALARRPTAGRSMRQWIDELVTHHDASGLVDMLVRTSTYDVELDRLDAAAACATWTADGRCSSTDCGASRRRRARRSPRGPR